MDDIRGLDLRTSRCTSYNDVLCGHGVHGLNNEEEDEEEEEEHERLNAQVGTLC